jgi:outer membrane protein assembly factor BamB
MGPNRDGVYAESGVVGEIPPAGLEVLWRAPVGLGYSGPAVAEGRVFVTDYVLQSGTSTNNPGGRDKMEGTERVLCLDASSGELLWKYEYSRPYDLSFPNGPRATPTVDGDRVYSLGAEGDLLCLDTKTGALVWQKQLKEEYNTESPIWGFAAHPLVEGNLLYTLAGGEGSAVVALDKKTGSEVWSALTTSDIGYCPPMIYEVGGKQQLIVWHSESLNALDPSSGEVYWSYPLQPRYGMSIAAPQLNGNLLFASGIGETSAMLELDDAGKPKQSLWDGKPKVGIYSGSATALFEDDAIYGSDCGSGAFIAVDPKNGNRYWETFELTTGGERRASHGTSFVVRRGDRHFIFTETGDLVIAKLSPEGYQELGRMHVLEPTGSWANRSVVWSHPAFADGCMFARNDKELVCLSLKAN